jgi:phage terminase large subunit-like protein
MFRVAAAAGTNDGGRPTLFCADELHEWIGNKARVFLVIANSLAKRRDGLVLVISTAGSEDAELLRGLYDHGKAVLAGELDDAGFLLDWAEADAALNPHDGPEVRRVMALQANPHAEQFGLLEHIERRWQEIPEHEWRRYFANQWVAIAAESWLPAGAWRACTSDLDLVDGAQTWAAIDMALKHDTVAVVHGQWVGERLVVRHRAWMPPEGGIVDVASVEAHLRDLHRRFGLVEVAYDPAYFQRSAEALVDDGLPMVEFPQSAARMIPACQTAYELVGNGTIAHDGSPVFADQVTSAAPRQVGEGWRLSKGKSRRKIDAAIALVMLVDRAASRQHTDQFYRGTFTDLDDVLDDDWDHWP